MQINKIRDDIKVTVVCITYNHEEVIRDALDSFLNQKTNFSYQIFVGEDKGPDGTAEVVREYAEKYPDKIVAFLREENMGAQHNLIDLCQRAKSPYIAFCEGDDYWIDDEKLQKQYNFMEENPEMRICFARARISAPEDWFLRSYFKANKDGEMIWPEGDPLCPKTRKNKVTVFDRRDFVDMFVAHTSTLFYRWNYELEIPGWYYEGIVGDLSLFLMQLGDGKCAMLPDVVSVYRRSDVGVYMSGTMDEHFLKTRMDWVRIMKGMITFYEDNGIKDFPKEKMIDRIQLEITNYIRSLIRNNQIDRLEEIIQRYPAECLDMFKLYTEYFFVKRQMTNVYSEKGRIILSSNRYFMHALKPFIRLIALGHTGLKKLFYFGKCALVYLAKFIGYWGYSLVPKKKNLWVFSGFLKQNYVDNSKYLFEYVVQNHPEIEAVWLTKNANVIKELEEKELPVCRMNSLRGIIKMARAGIAVIDHFIMSDYSQIYGFNHRTKVVQLWHGVGFKSMGDGKEVKNTEVPGVVYSTDILTQTEDSLPVRFWKKIKYFFCAPVRELFEQYFMFLCPGQWQIDTIGRKWNMDETCFCMAGHPRNIKVYERVGTVKKTNKVLYAPTYRFHYEKEKELVDNCIRAFGMIQDLMEEIDGQFVLRLHPHTWRNYETQILMEMEAYDRIVLDREKDFYDSLLEYSYVISDYSSTALDCSLFGIPAVFLCADYDWFVKNESGFTVDYLKMTPGPKAYSWEEAIAEIRNYLDNPDYMLKEREEILNYYFDKATNSQNDSENIVSEIKRRRGIE